MSQKATPCNSLAETAMRLIDEEVEHHLSLTQRWKFERNAESRICQLPTEILCRIFLGVRRAYEDKFNKPSPRRRLPYRFLWIFVTTHVCRHWRTVALNEPALWTFPALFLPKLGMLMLDRARMAGLFIQIDQKAIKHDLMVAVLQHMPHTKKFDILNGFADDLEELFSRLPSAAPMLETLIIRYEAHLNRFSDSVRTSATVPTTLFREVTSLRALTLKGLDIQDWNSPLFDHLTSLSLDNILQDKRPNLFQFKAMLERMPQLTKLTLGDACSSGEELQGQGATSDRPVNLPNLRTLSVGMSAPQVKAFYSIVTVPTKLEAIKTILRYRPEINFIDLFSIAKRAHLLDASSADMLHLRISDPQGGVAFGVTEDTNLSDDEDDRNSAQILIKSDRVHYSSTREAAANQHIFTGIMTALDWKNLQSLTINFDCLTQEMLRSSIGFLPRLRDIVLHGKVAVPFIDALHLGWDIDPETEPRSLAFSNLMSIKFYKMEFSFDEEDTDKDSLGLDLLQDCLMGRCERGAAIELVMIVLCEGICENDVDALWDIVPSVSWDGEEIGFNSDGESSE